MRFIITLQKKSNNGFKAYTQLNYPLMFIIKNLRIFENAQIQKGILTTKI